MNALLRSFAVAALFLAPLRADDVDALVAEVRAECEKVDALGKSARHIQLSEETPFEGGGWHEEHAWFDADWKLLKVSARGGVDISAAYTDYYFHDGALIFVFKSLDTADPEAKGQTRVKEERFYFRAGELIRGIVRAASFKPGEKRDLSKAAEQPKAADAAANDGETHADFLAEAQETAQRLRGAANPDVPAASADEKPAK